MGWGQAVSVICVRRSSRLAHEYDSLPQIIASFCGLHDEEQFLSLCVLLVPGKVRRLGRRIMDVAAGKEGT